MPLVNSVMPQGDWRKWEVTPLHFRLGDFLGTVVDFTIVAFVVFIVMVKLRRAQVNNESRGDQEHAPSAWIRCRSRRSAAAPCTSVLTAIAIALMLAAPAPASAQTNPAFVFAKPEEAKAGRAAAAARRMEGADQDGNDGDVGELAERRRKRGRVGVTQAGRKQASPSTLPPHTASRTSSCRCSATRRGPDDHHQPRASIDDHQQQLVEPGPLRSVLHHQQRGLR